MINYKLEKKLEEIVEKGVGPVKDINSLTGSELRNVDIWRLNNDLGTLISGLLNKYKEEVEDSPAFAPFPKVEDFLNKTLK